MELNKEKLGTIMGISNFQEWTWLQSEEKIGHIYACPLLGIGDWREYSPNKIEKIVKKRKFEKSNPNYTQHTEPSKLWTMPIVEKSGKFGIVFWLLPKLLLLIYINPLVCIKYHNIIIANFV